MFPINPSISYSTKNNYNAAVMSSSSVRTILFWRESDLEKKPKNSLGLIARCER